MVAKPYEECGIKSERVFVVECSMCSLAMNAEIWRKPEKTYYQVINDFNQIPLTDSQRGVKKRKK
jgi:hypothetical protein